MKTAKCKDLQFQLISFQKMPFILDFLILNRKWNFFFFSLFFAPAMFPDFGSILVWK